MDDGVEHSKEEGTHEIAPSRDVPLTLTPLDIHTRLRQERTVEAKPTRERLAHGQSRASGKTRYARLRKLNLSHDLAARTAGHQWGPWRLSRTQALSYAMPATYFDSLGLPM